MVKRAAAYVRISQDTEGEGLGVARQVDVVVAWHPDRLHRSPRELEGFITLLERTGTTVVTCTAGEYDLATPEGRLTARIVGSVARKKSEEESAAAPQAPRTRRSRQTIRAPGVRLPARTDAPRRG